jgi:hypothetical protein
MRPVRGFGDTNRLREEVRGMKKVVMPIILPLTFVLMISLAVAHHGPEVIVIDKIKEKRPPVTFGHWKHQERASDDCAVCHHTKIGDEMPVACSSCHGKDEAAPDFKKAMHSLCRGCHQKSSALGLDAPTECSGCHEKN